jgi:hypothetical protein
LLVVKAHGFVVGAGLGARIGLVGRVVLKHETVIGGGSQSFVRTGEVSLPVNSDPRMIEVGLDAIVIAVEGENFFPVFIVTIGVVAMVSPCPRIALARKSVHAMMIA